MRKPRSSEAATRLLIILGRLQFYWVQLCSPQARGRGLAGEGRTAALGGYRAGSTGNRERKWGWGRRWCWWQGAKIHQRHL